MTHPLPLRRLILSLGLCLWAGSSSFAAAPPADPARAQLADGKSRFDKLCISCHGADGAGKDTYGPALQNRPELSAALIRERIVKGKHGDHAMPPWGTVLDRPAIDALVAYVEVLRQPAAAGAADPLSPFDLNGDNVFDSGDLAEITVDGNPYPVIVSGKESDVGIIKTPGVLTPESGVTPAGFEFKYASGSSGAIEQIRESNSSPRGRMSWRQIQ